MIRLTDEPVCFAAHRYFGNHEPQTVSQCLRARGTGTKVEVR